MPDTPLVLDASAAIVLFASGHCREIIESWPGAVYVVPEVIAEAGFLRNTDPSRPEPKDPIDWKPIIDSQAVTVLARTDPSEFADLVRFALLVDDGEAAAGAAALHHGFTLVLDDRKARRVLGLEIPLLWSLDLVHHWCVSTILHTPDVAAVLADVRTRARYHPHASHPRIGWWEHYVGNAHE